MNLQRREALELVVLIPSTRWTLLHRLGVGRGCLHPVHLGCTDVVTCVWLYGVACVHGVRIGAFFDLGSSLWRQAPPREPVVVTTSPDCAKWYDAGGGRCRPTRRVNATRAGSASGCNNTASAKRFVVVAAERWQLVQFLRRHTPPTARCLSSAWRPFSVPAPAALPGLLPVP